MTSLAILPAGSYREKTVVNVVMASGRISRKRFNIGSRNFTHLSGANRPHKPAEYDIAS